MAAYQTTARSSLFSRIISSLWPSPPGRTRQQGANQPAEVSQEAADKLWWLTDVPLFIDDRLVDRLYNAVVRPEFILLQSSETAERSRSRTSTSELGATAEMSIPAFWKLGGTVKAAEESGEALTRGTQVTKQFVHSAERRLQEIVRLYGEKHPERLLFDEGGQSALGTLAGELLEWEQALGLLDIPGPRPLLFIDLQRYVPILPMAGGTEAGRTVVLSEVMIQQLRDQGKPIPDFPADTDKDAKPKKVAYWKALVDHYDNWLAMRVVDHGFGDEHRIEWINFRMKLSTRERPVHLHFSPAGKHHAGEFAYRLVRRGYKEGLRLVGLLKKGCDVNVISLYER